MLLNVSVLLIVFKAFYFYPEVGDYIVSVYNLKCLFYKVQIRGV